MERKVVDALTHEIIGAAIEVHKGLGPGLLEAVYENCLCKELELRSLTYRTQVPIPVSYKSFQIDCGYRLDILVQEMVVVEVKSVEQLLPVHEAQLLTYLRLGGWKAGLLINFNVPILIKGVRRFANHLEEPLLPVNS